MLDTNHCTIYYLCRQSASQVQYLIGYLKFLLQFREILFVFLDIFITSIPLECHDYPKIRWSDENIQNK